MAVDGLWLFAAVAFCVQSAKKETDSINVFRARSFAWLVVVWPGWPKRGSRCDPTSTDCELPFAKRVD